MAGFGWLERETFDQKYVGKYNVTVFDVVNDWQVV